MTEQSSFPAGLASNTSFSRRQPWLQLAIDSTSLGAFKNCPRFYYYSILCGWQPRTESVHLTFGLLMHQGLEHYHHARARGLGFADSLDAALDFALRATWNRELNRPWDSGDSYKNRLTLVRTLVGYLDKYGENDALQTVILANGKPAVELSFSFNSGYTSRLTGESFMLCGHLDRLATLNGDAYIPDVKTTKSELNIRYWLNHDPSNQFGMYLLAGDIVYNQSVKGLIVDGAQVLVNSSRFDRKLITKDAAQLDEFYRATGSWIRWMESCAEEAGALADPSQAYPMNEGSCGKYNGCDFQRVCSRSPASRGEWLGREFRARVWDPLQRRGDI